MPDEPSADEPSEDDRAALEWDASGAHDPHVSRRARSRTTRTRSPTATPTSPSPRRNRTAHARRPRATATTSPWPRPPTSRGPTSPPARDGTYRPSRHESRPPEGRARGGGGPDEHGTPTATATTPGRPSPADDAEVAPHEQDPARPAHRANGHDDPQATQPFDPSARRRSRRRTVSLPRPQTDTGEWDAPIGTVRVSRGGGGGGGGGGRYQAQPGASGYPPYRKLEVKPRRRWLRRIVVVLALLLAVAACAFAFLLFQPKHGSGHGTVVVTVPAGATADQIGDLLADRGVVSRRSSSPCAPASRATASKLRSGRYTLREGMSYGAALAALTTAPKAAPVVNITIPEGPSRREEAAKLRAAGVKGGYLAATRRSSQLDPRDYGAPRSTKSLEGFLFPPPTSCRPTRRRPSDSSTASSTRSRTRSSKVNMRRAKAQATSAATTCSSSPR